MLNYRDCKLYPRSHRGSGLANVQRWDVNRSYQGKCSISVSSPIYANRVLVLENENLFPTYPP